MHRRGMAARLSLSISMIRRHHAYSNPPGHIARSSTNRTRAMQREVRKGGVSQARQNSKTERTSSSRHFHCVHEWRSRRSVALIEGGLKAYVFAHPTGHLQRRSVVRI